MIRALALVLCCACSTTSTPRDSSADEFDASADAPELDDVAALDAPSDAPADVPELRDGGALDAPSDAPADAPTDTPDAYRCGSPGQPCCDVGLACNAGGACIRNVCEFIGP